MDSKRIREAGYFELGRQAERDGQLKDAVKQYLLVLKRNPAHIEANNRLMMVYRRLHEYSKEILLIKDAVMALELEKEQQQGRYINDHPEKARDTRELALTLGLLGKKGLPLVENEAVLRWQKRLPVIQKKLEHVKH